MLQVGDEVYHSGAHQMIIGKVKAYLAYPDGDLYQVADSFGHEWLMPASALQKIEVKETSHDE